MTTQKRSFGMHPHLLFDIILRQAGTLQKALLEGVMNSIDAGATECKITLDTHNFSVEDNGRGFQSHEEIKNFFETFGTPHEEGDATYGRFRMGRGQMMAFGRTLWRSRQFEMDVDVKNSGLDYELTEHKELFEGTRIEGKLYEPIAPSDLERTKSELRKFVAWAQIPVLLNGEQISKLPSEGKWDFEDEDAYYALSTERSQLSVYNLGVLVSPFWAGRFGIGGTIVTKNQVEVNFARNDIQSTCPVFKRIQAKIKKQTGQAAKKKTKLTDAERNMLVRDFLACDINVEDAAKLRALTDVNGRSWPLTKLTQISQKFGGNLIVSSRGDQMVETAQRRGIAFSIDESTLEQFGVNDGNAFVQRVQAICQTLSQTARENRDFSDHASKVSAIASSLKKIEVVDREFLGQFVDSGYIALAQNELTADQKLLLTAVSAGTYELVYRMNKASYEDIFFNRRNIHLGKSDTAYAWTDGTQNIWVNVEHARLLRKGYAGAYQLMLTMLHEMLHTGPDTGTHSHDHSFYQGYHDLSGDPVDPVGHAAKKALKTFVNSLRKSKRTVSAVLLQGDDMEQAIDSVKQLAETEDF